MKLTIIVIITTALLLSCGNGKKNKQFDPLDYMTDPPVLLDKGTGTYRLRDDSSFLDKHGLLQKGADTLLFVKFCEEWDIDPSRYINSETDE